MSAEGVTSIRPKLPFYQRLDTVDVAELEPAVIWRNTPDGDANGTVLCQGDVAVLSGAGGLGKSWVALSLSIAAAQAYQEHKQSGEACGLRIAAGPVMTVSYEDSILRQAWRMQEQIGGAQLPLYGTDDPEPIYTDNLLDTRLPGKLAAFERVFDFRYMVPSLVVIDPSSAALLGSPNSTAAARAMMRDLRHAARDTGTAVLLIAHDTKAARNEASKGHIPDAGAIAGSSAWHDAARGALYFTPDPADPTFRVLRCTKANYGKRGWGARLAESYDNGRFRGFEFFSDYEAGQ